MSNLKFAAGVVLAGALAFGGTFLAQAVTAPMLHGIPAGSSSGLNEPTEEAPMDEDLEAQLIGRWQAPEPANQDAYVEFTEHGLWFGSDGCNGAEGTWNVESNDTFDGGEGGAMTLMWCDNVNIPTAVWDAATVEITANDELVLHNDSGEELLLVRASSEAFMLEGRWVNKGEDTSVIEFLPNGDWVGSIGCAEFRGTWLLGVRDVPVLEDDSTEPTAPIILSGPAMLKIGPKPANAGTPCEGAPKEFVLKYDTEYVFAKSSENQFTLTDGSTSGAPIEGSLEFARN